MNMEGGHGKDSKFTDGTDSLLVSLIHIRV